MAVHLRLVLLSILNDKSDEWSGEEADFHFDPTNCQSSVMRLLDVTGLAVDPPAENDFIASSARKIMQSSILV
jgi:hypothetical protein